MARSKKSFDEELKVKRRKMLENHFKLGDLLIHLGVEGLNNMKAKVSNVCPHCKKECNQIWQQLEPEMIIEFIRTGIRFQQGHLTNTQTMMKSLAEELEEGKKVNG